MRTTNRTADAAVADSRRPAFTMAAGERRDHFSSSVVVGTRVRARRKSVEKPSRAEGAAESARRGSREAKRVARNAAQARSEVRKRFVEWTDRSAYTRNVASSYLRFDPNLDGASALAALASGKVGLRLELSAISALSCSPVAPSDGSGGGVIGDQVTSSAPWHAPTDVPVEY